MSQTIYPKGSAIKVGKHFEALEFDCKCSDTSCSRTVIDMDLISKLDAVHEDLGCAVHITSGNRCAAYQKKLKEEGYETAVGISQHQLGRAADFRTNKHSGDELAAAARRAGFKAVGIGKRWMHADLRSDRERCWYYKY